MSITPLNPIGMPPLSPEPQPGGLNESRIIRRWLWRQVGGLFRASLFIFIGMLLAAMLFAWKFSPNDDQFISEMAGNAQVFAACSSERNELQKQLAQIREQERRYATVLMEPNGAEKLVVGALGWLVGIPGAGEAVLGGLPGSDAKWVLQGKQKPMSSAPNTAYAWVDLETKQTEGPFKPEAVK